MFTTELGNIDEERGSHIHVLYGTEVFLSYSFECLSITFMYINL